MAVRLQEQVQEFTAEAISLLNAAQAKLNIVRHHKEVLEQDVKEVDNAVATLQSLVTKLAAML